MELPLLVKDTCTQYCVYDYVLSHVLAVMCLQDHVVLHVLLAHAQHV